MSHVKTSDHTVEFRVVDFRGPVDCPVSGELPQIQIQIPKFIETSERKMISIRLHSVICPADVTAGAADRSATVFRGVIVQGMH